MSDKCPFCGGDFDYLFADTGFTGDWETFRCGTTLIAARYDRHINCYHNEIKELKTLVRELLTEFIDPTTANLIITNRPEFKEIMEDDL
jgi:hypothetical protein